MLPQLGNVHDCLRYAEVTLHAIKGPMDGEGADIVKGGGGSRTSRGSLSMAAISSDDTTKVAPPAAGQTGPKASTDGGTGILDSAADTAGNAARYTPMLECEAC